MAPRPASGAAPTGARTPINPFLANDPHAKAKRLARALVSDLVTYFPQKRQDGLRDGTLKQLFKDEIQKSYEEYVDQVGRDFADSTTHFQDALNEILAAGQSCSDRVVGSSIIERYYLGVRAVRSSVRRRRSCVSEIQG
jgi:hypothetical protein